MTRSDPGTSLPQAARGRERRLAATPPGISVATDVFVARARNAELWDVGPPMAEVRGQGSMLAVAFRRADGSPDAAFAKQVQATALKQGLILLTCGADAEAIRFLYPLTIDDATFAEALDILAASLRASLS